ncbi:hypothetical protein CLU79DRAFT_694099, partial [Phycomyces nitens]
KEETWEDWENDDEFNEEAKCLFCTKIFDIPEEAFVHCKKEHGFDFLAVKRALDLDFYKCIRMLNYIRKQVKENPELASTKEYKLTGKETFWEDDALLQPVLEDDALLHAFEELEIIEEEEEKAKGHPVLDLSSIVPTTELEHSLIQLVKHSQEKAKAIEEQFNEYKAMIRPNVGRLSWRVRLGHLLESEALHWTILGLTLIDTVCVLIQILYTFFHECKVDVELKLFESANHNWILAFELAEIITATITCMFVIECLLHLIAFGPRYYLPGWTHWKLHVFDIAVVGSTFVLEVILRGKEREVAGLLIIFRLWRIVKVIDAVIKGVNYSNEERIDSLIEELDHSRAAYAALQQELSEKQAAYEELQARLEKTTGAQ